MVSAAPRLPAPHHLLDVVPATAASKIRERLGLANSVLRFAHSGMEAA